ncbi:MAG: ATP-binding protein [Methylibium sp.]|nr:ATP-binding protein [Methylibium sp.]MBA3623520.1 ATP-binding protein [Methylibium sp.]
MLLEFRVRNYRSIRDEQSLNLAASNNDKELAATHLSSTGLKSLPNAVRSAVVYGPNASGKSTLLRGLDYMRAVVAESATVIQPGAVYNVQPFKLDEAFAQAPTEFEITFMLEGVRHQYAFAMTPQRIVNESLVVYRTTKPTQWFSRRLADDGDTYEYDFSTHLTGSRKLWQDSTRPNALFLSTAAQLNSEQLSPVFRWIVESIVFLPAHAMLNHDVTTAMLATPEGRAQIRDFLTTADISIADVQVVPRKGFRNQVVFHAGTVAHSSSEEGEFLVPVFQHTTPKGSAKFELQDESEGTQRLYGLVAPVLDVLRDGRILVVDELDSSLHTLLVRRLISMFHDPSLNRSGAQLVFSTHDTTLLNHTLFRRDQVWFTEKDSDQATRLYPLTDFSPRKHEAWERGYLMGRYGAVPFFRELPDIVRQPSARRSSAATSSSTPTTAA